MFSRAEIGAEFGATKFQKRAEDVSDFGVNAAEAGESGTAKNVGKNGFGLVVGGVSDGDAIEVFFGREAFEERVASAAGGVFEIGVLLFGFGEDVFARDEEGKVVAFCERGDKFFIGVRSFAAEFVIEVDDGKNDAEFFVEFEEKKKERDGVSSSGDGDADTLSGRGPMVLNEMMRKADGEVGDAFARLWIWFAHD